MKEQDEAFKLALAADQSMMDTNVMWKQQVAIWKQIIQRRLQQQHLNRGGET